MSWRLEIIEAAQEDLRRLNNSVRMQVYKALDKVKKNPLPRTQGGYGEPLGNKHGYDLTGLCKVKLRSAGIRIVYRVEIIEGVMRVIVVGARADDEVYRLASERTKNAGE